MMTDGAKITLLDGKELDLVLNTEAMAELCDEFGDLEKIGDMLNNASYSEKIRLVPRLISILATQGEAIKGNDTNISPDYILRQTLPKDIPAMTGAFLRAIEIGMNIKYTMEDSETDEVLAEIEKNGQGAAGTCPRCALYIAGLLLDLIFIPS